MRPSCDTETLLKGRLGVRQIAHCRTCGGFLLPSSLSLLGISLPVPFSSRVPVSSRISGVRTVLFLVFVVIIVVIIGF